jgi:hypothetical protein
MTRALALQQGPLGALYKGLGSLNTHNGYERQPSFLIQVLAFISQLGRRLLNDVSWW